MAKILLFSDIHVHPHKRSAERLQDCLKCLNWCFETAKELRVDFVLFGGDLLHERQKIDSYTFTEVFKVLEKNQNSGFKTYLLLGNHDMWFASSWSVNSIYPFGCLQNFETITETKEIAIGNSNWHFMPYTHDPIKELDNLPREKINQSYFLGHVAIDGSRLNSSGSLSDVVIEHDGDMVKVDKKFFSDYIHAFFGHYHSAQKLAKNVEYIGSPLQLSFGEAHESKHIILLDTDTNKMKYIENKFSPKHFYIKDTDIDNYDQDLLSSSFVCILSENTIDNQQKKEIEKKLENLNVSSLQIRQQTQKMQEHVLHDAKSIIADESTMIKKYVEQIKPSGLIIEDLVSLGMDIVNFQPAELGD
jgi:DNA repair exonuclease SbcCD nuclease subunit